MHPLKIPYAFEYRVPRGGVAHGLVGLLALGDAAAVDAAEADLAGEGGTGALAGGVDLGGGGDEGFDADGAEEAVRFGEEFGVGGEEEGGDARVLL